MSTYTHAIAGTRKKAVMYEPVETIHSDEHEGWKVDLFPDWDAESPASWDTLGTLVRFHALDYTFGHRTADGTEEDAVERGGWKLLTRYLRLTEGIEAITWRLDEGGGGQARLYSSDYEGSNPSGFIYVDRANIVKEYGDDSPASRARARGCLESELQEWGMYVAGDVWGYVVKGPNGEHESCWGFYGYEYACAEAKDALQNTIDWAIREELKVSRSCAL